MPKRKGAELTTGKSVREALGIPAVNKYRNKPTQGDGVRFDSKKEAERWQELQFLEKQGLVRNLRRQVRYPLTVNGKLVTTYIADACYFDVETGREVVEDAKGIRTPVYIIKRRLMLALRGITIKEV